jgi:hypothetical protein
VSSFLFFIFFLSSLKTKNLFSEISLFPPAVPLSHRLRLSLLLAVSLSLQPDPKKYLPSGRYAHTDRPSITEGLRPQTKTLPDLPNFHLPAMISAEDNQELHHSQWVLGSSSLRNLLLSDNHSPHFVFYAMLDPPDDFGR